jgi:hypothetical protein
MQFNAPARGAVYAGFAARSLKIEMTLMAEGFEVGDHVTWSIKADRIAMHRGAAPKRVSD